MDSQSQGKTGKHLKTQPFTFSLFQEVHVFSVLALMVAATRPAALKPEA